MPVVDLLVVRFVIILSTRGEDEADLVKLGDEDADDVVDEFSYELWLLVSLWLCSKEM